MNLLFGGLEEKTGKLYQTDPSGTLVGYLAKGVGSAQDAIQILLDKHFKEGLNEHQALVLGLSILK